MSLWPFNLFYPLGGAGERDLVSIKNGGNLDKNRANFSGGTITVDGRGIGGACVGFAQADYLEVPSSTDYDLATGTLMFWFRTSQPANPIWLWSRVDSSNKNGFAVFIDTAAGTPITCDFNDATSNKLRLTGPSGLSNTWQQVVIQWNQGSGQTCNMLINGNLYTSGTLGGSWSFNNEVIRFGVALDSFWTKFGGQMDVCGIWNRWLTADEIQSLYLNPFQMFLPPTTRRVFFVAAAAKAVQRRKMLRPVREPRPWYIW